MLEFHRIPMFFSRTGAGGRVAKLRHEGRAVESSEGLKSVLLVRLDFGDRQMERQKRMEDHFAIICHGSST